MLQIAANLCFHSRPRIFRLVSIEFEPSLQLTRGTTIAPLIGGYLIFQFFFDENTSGAESVQVPYLIFGSVFLLLALVVKQANLPLFKNEEEVDLKSGSALQYSHLVLGIVAIFAYVGGEVSIGSFIISFVGLEKLQVWKKQKPRIIWHSIGEQ